MDGKLIFIIDAPPKGGERLCSFLEFFLKVPKKNHLFSFVE